MAKSHKKLSLGELEAEIMDVLWSIHCGSVRDVLSQLKRKRSAAYTTIMTVMSRLFDKGLLKRKMDDTGAYLYCPAQPKDEYVRATSRQAIALLLKEYGEVAVAQFADALSGTDDKEIKKWREKLKQSLR